MPSDQGRSQPVDIANIAVVHGGCTRSAEGSYVPDISGFHGLLVQTHVVGVVLLVAAHAVSAFVLLNLFRERDPSRLRRLLSLSSKSLLVAAVGLLMWLIAGILAGFSGNWWTSGRLWIWASLVLAIAVTAVMTPMGRLYMDRVRASIGVDPKRGSVSPDAVVDPAAVDAAIASGRPALLAAIGIGGLVLIFYLMVAKPF